MSLNKKLSYQYIVVDFDSWNPDDLGMSTGDLIMCRCAGAVPGSPSGDYAATIFVTKTSTSFWSIQVIWLGNIWTRSYSASTLSWSNWDIPSGSITIPDFDTFDPTVLIGNTGKSVNVISTSDATGKPYTTTSYLIGSLKKIAASTYLLEVYTSTPRHFYRSYQSGKWGEWKEVSLN